MPYDQDQWDLIKAKISRILATHPPYPGTTTWYVAKSGGSDTTGDGSEEQPWQTITHALTKAGARDTIIAWGNMQEDSLAPIIGQRLFGLGNGLSILRKTTNTAPGIIVGELGIEVAGFIVDGIASTGHGIQIVDSDDCHIHDNIIRNITGAYDGIDKSAGGVNTGLNIHDNEIIDGAGSGIGMVDVTESKIERNTCLRNAAEGIILNATCDDNVLNDNICNENNEGIELQGDNNHLRDNTTIGNTVANIVDTGTNNRWAARQKTFDIAFYPVAKDIGTTEISDDGTTPALLAEVSEANANEAAGEADPQWTEDIPIDEEGIAEITAIYFEGYWQQKRTGGTTSSAKWQVTRDGGTNWVDLTDNVAEVGAVYADKTRIGVSLPITSIAPGKGQLRLRLCAWTDGASVETRVRSDTFIRLSGRKN